ncbi:MAG: hypothetical protein AAGE52_00240 [Myxococcota bacterium]
MNGRFCVALLVAAHTLPVARSEAQEVTCTVEQRACDQEDAAFTRQMRRLSEAHADVRPAFESLRLRRLAACHDYNVCGATGIELQRIRLWSEGELEAFRSVAANPASRTVWARGLGSRFAFVVAAGVQTSQVTPPRPVATPQVRQAISQMENDIESLEGLQPILPRIRDGLTSRRGRLPSACSEEIRNDLRAVVRLGGTAASEARGLRGDLDRYCRRFELHLQPDEAHQNRMRRFVTTLTRIDGYIADIRRCADPGPYTGRCRNAYGDQTSNLIRELRQADRIMRDVRRAVGNIPETTFPCNHRIWRRVEESEWLHSTLRAQIPGLSRSAKRLCEAIGIDDEEVNEQKTRILNTVEQRTARTRDMLRSRRESVASMRRNFGLEDE